MESTLTPTDTIVAIASPHGRGAITMVRLSGAQALTITDKVWKGASLADASSHTAHLGYIFESKDKSGEPLDQALATVFKAPHSFTGENMVELGLHGSPLIARMVISALIKAGARPAEPGEFSRRAVANGRMSLVSAEAAADLVAASSRAARRIAMSQMRGGVEKKLAEMTNQLLNLASLLELELDFSEEDVEFASRIQLRELAFSIRKHLLSLQSSYRTGQAIKEGIPVAIIGPTNAGKSSLLNNLVNDERAIVSDIHGTTRDIIEDSIEIDEYLFRFMDTAGLRETNDPIEQIGIAQSKRAQQKARIVLLVTDATSPLPQSMIQEIRQTIHTDSTLLIIRNKSDLLNTEPLPDTSSDTTNSIIYISTKTGSGIPELKARLSAIAYSDEISSGEILLTNERHLACVTEALQALDNVLNHFDTTPDLIAQSIRAVIAPLSDLTGSALQTPTVLQNIFSRFCIGK